MIDFVVSFKHHMTGEAWPADSDSTGREQRGGDSKGVKCKICRKRGEPFPRSRREQVPLR